MKNILLPTDFSDNSWNAIQYALQLFKAHKCVFHLLNVYTPVVYDVQYFEVATAQAGLIDAMKITSKKGLDKFLTKINKEFKNKNHTFSTISSFNTLEMEIEELYQGNVIDFIIMGTQGASGLKEVLFGTNTVHIIKNAKCPVLAIPNDFSFEAPHEILFPSDYEIDFQEKHIQPILELTSLFHARVHILNASFGYPLSEKQEKNKQKLVVFFKHIAHLFHSISNQSVPEAIANFQLKTRINLLVMINNKHSFFENLFFKSKIKQIGFHLNVPFLVIPSKI
ncbi:universal stress protein [uncultured Polaribacter sp.]|uniref:universal stress protein n=1 Tax=uncultured Polaribacter sp. TaxID=174711 RepID=UPI00261B4A27|nr:universal stress protein [uncultured Polaribacter sp.]